MRSEEKIMTAFRFEPWLYNRLKQRAKENGQTMNGYIENLLKADMALQFPHFDTPIIVSKQVSTLGNVLPNFTKDELESDEKLSYLLSK